MISKIRELLVLVLLVSSAFAAAYVAHVVFALPERLEIAGEYRNTNYQRVAVIQRVSEKTIVCLHWEHPTTLEKGKECAEEVDQEGTVEIILPDEVELSFVSIRPYFVFFHELWNWRCDQGQYISCSPW